MVMSPNWTRRFSGRRAVQFNRAENVSLTESLDIQLESEV